MIRKIYFMGIKGVGMANLAILAKEAGFIVAGSDVVEEFITDSELKNKNIYIYEGFKSENVMDFFGTTPCDESLMIITGAHGGFENEEVKAVMSMGSKEVKVSGGIKVITHGEAVGKFMSGEFLERSDIEGISIAGSHGKTTISAMIATYLSILNQNPSYIIGTSNIIPIGESGKYGTGKYFIAEADEYKAAPTNPTPRFLYQYPKYMIINNIDFDHPDVYSDLNAVKEAFASFIENLSTDGILFINGDDENTKDIRLKAKDLKVITYGTGEDNEFVISNFAQNGFKSSFSVHRRGVHLGQFKLSVAGYHNAKNSLAAIALLLELGVSVSNIARVLPEFGGSKRRMELVGKTQDGVEIIDDYAHHPEEIRKTLEAIKLAFPGKKLIVVFQAHTFSRTKALESEFVSSFAGVSELIILPTFASARSETKKDFSQDRDFVEKVRSIQTNVKLIEHESDVVKYLSANLHADNVVITMGAGDVYKIGEKLKSQF